MNFELHVEAGEIYRNRTTDNYYVIFESNKYVKYIIFDKDWNKKYSQYFESDLDSFMTEVRGGNFSLISRIDSDKLAKALLM